MTMVIDEVYLPIEIEQGAVGGPEFSTTILEFDNGVETSIQNWSQVRHSWEVTVGAIEKLGDGGYLAFKKFFLARRGKLRGFLFKDWTDFEMPLQTIGTGNGVETDFLLTNTYDDDELDFVRIITRPVISTFNVYDNAGLVNPADYTFANGLITFDTAPLDTHVITAVCEFDNPVRFDTDKLNFKVFFENAASVNNFGLIEINEYNQ